jgi:peptide/nickel transport system permease protein
MARVLAVVLGALILLAFIGPIVAPYGSNQQDIASRLQGPGGSHWLGADYLGRDTFSLLLYGTRLTMQAGFGAVALAVLLGVPIGLFAGYRRGSFGAVTNTVSDVLLSMPPLIFAMAVIGIRGPGLTNAMIAIGILLAPRLFRVARATSQQVTEMTYIEAARSLGCSTRRIIVRHVLTNSLGPILVQVTFSLGIAIVAEASLSFLGLGVQPPAISLGSMVQDAFSHISDGSGTLFPPAILIVVLVYVVSALGDSMQDAFVRGGER